MSRKIQFASTADWDANTSVVFFDWTTGKIVRVSDGALITYSDANITAQIQLPTGSPGSVSIPAGAAAGTYFALAFETLTPISSSESFYGWGDEIPLTYDGTDLVVNAPSAVHAGNTASDKILVLYTASGKNVGFKIFHPASGFWYNNSTDSLELYNSGNYAKYPVHASADDSGLVYTAIWPPSLTDPPYLIIPTESAPASDFAQGDFDYSPYEVTLVPAGGLLNVNGALNKTEHDHLLSIDPNLATVRNTVDSDGELELVEGNDYSLNPITFTRSNTPDFTTATVKLAIMSEAHYNAGTGSSLVEVTGTVSIDSSVATFTFEPTPTNIAILLISPPNDPLDLVYEVRATIGGKDLTTHLGSVTVLRAVFG
jgi:hypothetical protein